MSASESAGVQSLTLDNTGAPVDSAERRYRAFEFGALFGVLPALLAIGPARFPVLVMLGTAVTVCLALLLTDRTFDRRQLWNPAPIRSGIAGVVVLWVIGVVVLSGIVWWGIPEAFFQFPRERPGRWLLICAAYPILSVLPQNIVYRAFIFHRYRDVFRSETAMLWASAAAFAWAHLVFKNPIAISLTLAGGLIFARTYQRHQSTLLVSIEHALYGLLVFTVGLGHALYLDVR